MAVKVDKEKLPEISENFELEIKENEQWLIQLLNTLPNGVQECDAKGRILFSNVAHHRILGLKSGELIGKNVWDYQPDESKKQEIRDHLAYLLAEKPAAEPYVTTNITRVTLLLFAITMNHSKISFII